jgi:hypothetical protein
MDMRAVIGRAVGAAEDTAGMEVEMATQVVAMQCGRAQRRTGTCLARAPCPQSAERSGGWLCAESSALAAGTEVHEDSAAVRTARSA